MNTLDLPQWLPSFAMPFVSLSYPTAPPPSLDSFPNSSYYHVGLLDGCFIISCIAVMAVLRDLARLYVLEPFAEWKLKKDLLRQRGRSTPLIDAPVKEKVVVNGDAKGASNGHANGNGNGHPVEGSPPLTLTRREAIKMHRSVLRFAEQGWSVIYYTYQWSFGLYVHRNLPTKVLDPINVWITYPQIILPGPLKFYYLTQTAFYLHQMLILNAEARRKDHWQMMTHHVITVALMISSYAYNYTRVGCLIMMLMDLCDIFLPLAKMFRYLSFSALCDVTFVCFLVSWFVTRHVLFVIVIVSHYSDTPRIIPRVWDPERGIYMTKGVYIGFNTMLIALQIIQVMWFWMICRVAWRVISGQGAEDTRSDSEDSEVPEEENVVKVKREKGKKDR